MIVIEIEENRNCEALDMRVFHDLEPPRPVSHVRWQRHAEAPAWHAVTGWTVSGHPCPAVVQKVDDSGEGVALLVHGGDAGLRLQPEEARAPWHADDPRQWGLPFVLTTDPQDLRFD